MPAPTDDVAAALAARYGQHNRPGWVLPVAIAAAAIGLVTFTFLGWRLASPAVTVTALAHQVHSDHQVAITFEVYRDGTESVVCVIRAQDEKHHDVGYATVTIAPGADYVKPTYLLATRARTYGVEVLGCAPNTAPPVMPPQFPPGTTNPAQQAELPGR